MWFKITLAKDGAVRSCEEVAHSFENSEHVLFIEAKSRAQAIERCRKIWKTRYRKRLYYEKKELWICTSCNEPALPGYSICEFHRARAQEANVKTYDKKRALGLTGNERVPENLDGRRQQQAEMIAARRYGANPSGLLNLRTLLIVKANFEQLDADKFSEWLDGQIAEYRAKQRNWRDAS